MTFCWLPLAFLASSSLAFLSGKAQMLLGSRTSSGSQDKKHLSSLDFFFHSFEHEKTSFIYIDIHTYILLCWPWQQNAKPMKLHPRKAPASN